MAETNLPSPQFPPKRPDLSVDRTSLAHERTLMAWTRTATSLISFGFTIYKFFQSFPPKDGTQHLLGPTNFALAMISIGLVSLLFATAKNWRDMKVLEQNFGAQPRYLVQVMAGLISILGFLGLVAVIWRQ